jgi:hypothetical protein
MDMISHEDLGVDAAGMIIHGLREPAAVLRVVVFAEEDRAAIVATLNHVERLIGQEMTTEPSH